MYTTNQKRKHRTLFGKYILKLQTRINFSQAETISMQICPLGSNIFIVLGVLSVHDDIE